jgi:hypothetical protein
MYSFFPNAILGAGFPTELLIAPPLVVHPERELPSPVYEVPPASASEIFERFRHNARVTRPANALTDRKYFRLWF